MGEITKFDDKCVIVRIPIGSQTGRSLYDATRQCWSINLCRAKKADYLLGTIDGKKVICVIKIINCDYEKAEFYKKEEKICKEVFGTDTELCKIKKELLLWVLKKQMIKNT